MKKFRWVFMGMVVGVILAFGFLWLGSLHNAQAEPVKQVAETTPQAPPSDEGVASDAQQAVAGDDEIPPPELLAGGSAPSVLPTAVPGESLLYFVPSDNDATATVLYLYNTDTVDHTVLIRAYGYSGTLVYSLTVNIPAGGTQRLASDSIASAPPPSWATPAPVITNFTDFSALASVSLPKGVKVDGYVLFNPGTGVVDPRADQGAIPLRFSSDPATVFLPAVAAP